MQIDVKDLSGKPLKSIKLPEQVFGAEMREPLLHTAIKAYQANRRQGTHAVKTRSFVSGGGKKPFKQKGTGGARQGTLRGPHMPGGAVVHGPQPRSYRQKLNAKVKAAAVRVAISDRVRAGKLIVIDDFGISKYSTKHVANLLKRLNVKNALLADERKDDFLVRSAANIQYVSAASAGSMNAEAILRHENVIMTEKALNIFVNRLSEEA